MPGLRTLTAFLLLFLCISCAKTPYTDRTQLMLMDSKDEMALGLNASRDILKKEKLSTDPKLNARIKRVGAKIAAVADQPDYKWEFYVIEKDDVVNAFCLPGGKIFFYTGIFRYMKNEDEIAVVMGHEAAHAIARHGAERMSISMAAQIGGAVVVTAVAATKPEYTDLVAAAYGIGSTLGVMLPYSRKHEYEADEIGLILTAKAGYRPGAAIDFWTRMSTLSKGKKPPEFLSTHPSDDNRIAYINSIMPKVEGYLPQPQKSPVQTPPAQKPRPRTQSTPKP